MHDTTDDHGPNEKNCASSDLPVMANGNDEITGNANRRTRLELCLLIASLFCGTFIMALDATIIGTAVPSITTEFNSLDDIAWYGMRQSVEKNKRLIGQQYGYYLPIYFQAVKGSTATQSGTQFLALAIPQIFGVVFSGAFVPFIIIGTAVGTVGCGLFLMLDLDTSTVIWAVFLVVCGAGTGFAINLPYTIAQAVLTALSLSIGQTIFLNRLKAAAKVLTPSIPDSVIVNAGAYNLKALASTDEIYNQLRQVYMDALHSTYIFPLGVAGVALLVTFAIEHKNIKTIEKERQKAQTESEKV
ncbi:hypothetical protein N0V82_003251 [Gnomoniopsis sp. IMI 355080]|nr:hypothetical protein N0V82_003251 [Gnomoniopsis sp. IMI 355080]